MFTEFLVSIFYSNKTFQNPILGKLSCDVLKQTFYQCKTHQAFANKQQACQDLKYLMKQCYMSNQPQQINQLINQQFKQAYQTTSFFHQRHSKIINNLFDNSWAVFYNQNNLKKYEKFINVNIQEDNKMKIMQK